MKRYSTSNIIRELKIKTIRYHLLEWLKSKTLITPYCWQGLQQQELSFIAGRNAKWYSHTVWQFLNKTKHAPTPWYLPKGVEHLYLHKSLRMNVHRNFYSSSPKLGSNQDALQQVRHTTIVYPYNGIVFAMKRK